MEPGAASSEPSPLGTERLQQRGAGGDERCHGHTTNIRPAPESRRVGGRCETQPPRCHHRRQRRQHGREGHRAQTPRCCATPQGWHDGHPGALRPQAHSSSLPPAELPPVSEGATTPGDGIRLRSRRGQLRRLISLGLVHHQPLDRNDEAARQQQVDCEAKDRDRHRCSPDAKAQRDRDDAGAHLATRAHAQRQREAGAQVGLVLVASQEQHFPDDHQHTDCEDVASEHKRAQLAPRPEQRGHGETHEQHEDRRDDALDKILPVLVLAVGGCLTVRQLGDTTQDERWQQDLEVNAAAGEEAEELAAGGDACCVHQGPASRAGHPQLVQLRPREAQQRGHPDGVDQQLPLEAYQVHLERDHKQDGVKVVENGQDASLLEEPGLLQASCLQHAEQDAGAGGRGEARHQQGRPPRHGAGQHVVQPGRDEEPRQACGRHRHDVVLAIVPQSGLVDVELVPDIHHEEREAEHRQDSQPSRPRAIVDGAQVEGRPLRTHQTHHQHSREDHEPPLVWTLLPDRANIG
mmetsp:Transcript_77646/g.199945  ORF Transcript_77646/g.199945 Transcript_77646/m.199945 type:complete len:520 (+) Transcript_77646:212-1771(+)